MVFVIIDNFRIFVLGSEITHLVNKCEESLDLKFHLRFHEQDWQIPQKYMKHLENCHWKECLDGF